MKGTPIERASQIELLTPSEMWRSIFNRLQKGARINLSGAGVFAQVNELNMDTQHMREVSNSIRPDQLDLAEDLNAA